MKYESSKYKFKSRVKTGKSRLKFHVRSKYTLTSLAAEFKVTTDKSQI